MKTSNLIINVIQAEEGKYLTQAEEVNIEERIITNDKVYLAVNDSADNWREITEEEKHEYERLQEEAREKATREQHQEE